MTEKIFPYELPENWRWTTLENVCELSNGENLFDRKFPYLDVKYLRGKKEKNFIESGNYIAEGSKVILVDGENSGEIFTVRENGYLGSTLRALKIFKNVDANFFQYFVSTKKDLYRKNKKGSAIPHLNKNLFYSTQIPLPPLEEQKRIVERIESLFSKLDSAKSIVQKFLDGYELRRSAILHKAFTGELTKNFRAENNLSLDIWEKVCFDKIADIKSNLVDPKNYPDVPHIAPDNIEKKSGKLLTYHTVLEDKIKSSKHKFFAGQILYSKIRPYLSKVVLINFDGLCSADMYPISVKNTVCTRYLWHYMLSEEFLLQVDKNAGSRSVLPKINQKELSATKIILPSLAEQKEIMRLLDSLLDKEQRAKELAENILQEIDLLKKSILARAFHGEL